MLTTGQADQFRTFGFVVLRSFLGDRVGALRAEVDAAVRDAYAATYDERVIDGISGHYLPMASRLTPAFDLYVWHTSTGGRDRLAWTTVYQRCPETEEERDRTLRSVHDGFEQAFRGAVTRRLLRSRPPRQALAWAGARLGGPVISARALHGGMSSAVHRIADGSQAACGSATTFPRARSS
jgi:hypothetical protein